MDRDHRLVPLELIREFTRSKAELSSIRTVADEAGVGRSTMHKFITAGTMPHPRVRRLLALWYLRQKDGLGIDETELMRPYQQVFRILLSEVPEAAHASVTAAVLVCVAEGCTEEGEEVPRWVTVMRERLPWAGLNTHRTLAQATTLRPAEEAARDNEARGAITVQTRETEL